MDYPRLIHVNFHDEWRQETVNIVVHFKRPLNQEQGQIFKQLVNCWARLGLHGAYPDPTLQDHMHREDWFKFGSIRYWSEVEHDFTFSSAQVTVETGGVGELWFTILLNCLETFHIEDAPIERIEIKGAG